jgi:cell division cycle 2-like
MQANAASIREKGKLLWSPPTAPPALAPLVSTMASPSAASEVPVDDGATREGDDLVRKATAEYAGATNLRQHAQARGPFVEGEVRDAMAQLLSGVASAHATGVLHRELVPENILVDDGDQVLKTIRRRGKNCKTRYTICGFNASELVGSTTSMDGSSQLASAAFYRAPELFLGSRAYDGGVDTWALGCVMAELLAGAGGVPFFFRESEGDVFRCILRVVGARGVVEWSGFEHVAASPEQAASLRERYAGDTGCLREAFPEETLSHDGFDVLSGLLQSNPDRRLTAAAALEMPWFRRRRRRLGFRACCFTPRASS